MIISYCGIKSTHFLSEHDSFEIKNIEVTCYKALWKNEAILTSM